MVRAAQNCVDDCGCSRRALYNFKGEPPLYCSDHKRDDMVPPLESLAGRYVGLKVMYLLCDAYMRAGQYIQQEVPRGRLQDVPLVQLPRQESGIL